MSLEGIYKEFEDALAIAERVRMREYLKLQMTTLKLNRINDGLKIYREEAKFNPEFDRAEYVKNKENVSKMAHQVLSKKAAE